MRRVGALSRSEQQKLVREARAQGFLVERRPNGHWRVTNPETGRWRTIAFSPKTSGGTREAARKLRSIGLE